MGFFKKYRLTILIFLPVSCGQENDILEPEVAAFSDDAVAEVSEVSIEPASEIKPEDPEASENTELIEGEADGPDALAAPSIDAFTVAEQDLETVLVQKDAIQNIQWQTSNAETCSLTQGNDQISDEKSGSLELAFSQDAPMSLSCTNAEGVIVNKVISVAAIPDVVIIKFNLSGQDADIIGVKKDKEQILEWEATGAESCSILQDDTPLSTEHLGSEKLKFKTDAKITIQCLNLLGIQAEKIFNIVVVPDPKITSFSVGGEDKKNAEFLSGSNQQVVWASENAVACSVKQGGVEIGNTPAGAVDIVINAATDLTIDCENSIGIIKSKKIEVNLILIGGIAATVNAFFFDPGWSGMVIRIDANNNFLATYDYDEGSVIGTYNPATGEVEGTWCEEDDFGNRASSSDHVGDAEFFFVQEADGKIKLDGRWREGSSGDWNNDWKMDLIPNPNSDQEAIENDLIQRLSNSSTFCP
ncbi:MAG: hypothetical protein HRU09_19990 [Oligoflexales bacterium]|nr:hypothetical protein [Oligoflexales bacterium]